MWLLLLALAAPALAALAVAGAAARQGRPIVTGCLLECGVQDQSCVTQCQVCVEEHQCATLKSSRCGDCLREVRESTYARATAHGVAVDSGGVPLAHEGVQLRLEAARFRSVDEVRVARNARDSVLVAQRQVEWAAEEWTDQSMKLRQAKAEVKLAESQRARSTLQHAKKIKKLKSQITSTQFERQRLEEELEKSQRKLRNREEGSGRRTLPAVEAVAGGGVIDRERAREWALQRHLGTHERMEKHLEKRLRYEEEHAKWLDRGLEKDVEKAEQRLGENADRVRHARAVTRMAEDNLRQSKDRYRSAQAMSLRAGKVVDHLEGMLKDRLGPIMPEPPMSYEGGPNQTVASQQVEPSNATAPPAELAYT